MKTMRIPSYDDLTPSIPDTDHGDVLASVATLLPDGGPVASRTIDGTDVSHQLFAALSTGPADLPSLASNSERATARQAARTRGPRTADRGLADLLAIAKDFSPRIAHHPGGTVVLDVAGLQRLFGDPAAIAEQLSAAGAPAVAVARSQTAALLLARARAGVSVAIGDPEAALRDVPIAVLETWLVEGHGGGGGHGTGSTRGHGGTDRVRTRNRTRSGAASPFDVLRRWGLSTIGEFAALPAAELSARLGSAGVAMQRLARGLDPGPLVPDPEVPRFAGTVELEWPIELLEPLSFVFARLLDPLAEALERADRGAIALHLDLRLIDRTVHHRSLPLPAPMRDPRVLRTLLLLDLESHPPSAAVDVVSIEVDPAPGRVVQYSLLERAVPSPETLATLMARLGALVGEVRCGSPRLIDVHRPDAFVMTRPVFGDRVNSQPPTPNSQAESFERVGSKSIHYARPEVFHRVFSSRSSWELGGGSWELTSRSSEPPAFVLRRFRPPVAVRVAVDAGRPVRLAIDRRGMPGGTVCEAAGPWRTSGGWWDTGRWNRDEWDVALSDGAVCRVFRDRDNGQWFVDGVYD
jgi:protein ImuB